jgi:hypothetical protein
VKNLIEKLITWVCYASMEVLRKFATGDSVTAFMLYLSFPGLAMLNRNRCSTVKSILQERYIRPYTTTLNIKFSSSSSYEKQSLIRVPKLLLIEIIT